MICFSEDHAVTIAAPRIEIDRVTHHYGTRRVLHDVDLAVAAGELVALVGPNGMGKSTILAIAAGVLSPVRGQVRIDGLRRRESEEAEIDIRRRVVYLPADPWLPGHRSGREWVIAVGRTWGVDDDDRLFDHADRLFDLFDLTDQADQPISSYSSGQKKKVALCATLATDAPILLLDEPFSGGLDPSGILALKRILQRRNERGAPQDAGGVTVLLTTPVPELIEELADRVAIIKDGRVAAVDTIAALRDLADHDGPFAEVYERLLNPRATDRIDRYFDAEARPR
jgi:ABC-type multidrug transport system ATPase subunit